VQFHLLAFEGPDSYSRAGGIATRVEGLTQALAAESGETHLWFIGDPDKPGNELHGSVNLHRWAQWVSRHHPGGVYDGEVGKASELARSLPPHLMREFLVPHISEGGQPVVLAEEWQTADAVLHLDYLLRCARMRDQVIILWNANNTFGFHRIPWDRLAAAAIVTTVSRYMKHQMWHRGVDPLVIPNGLSGDAFVPPDQAALLEIQRSFRGRSLLAKMARWDPDKRWLAALDIVAAMKHRNWRPLLIARGGTEPHGEEVLAAARDRGLCVTHRKATAPGIGGLLGALRNVDGADVVNLHSHVDAVSRPTLFHAMSAVLANSGHEPFGLVGLEAMAAGGIACTGCSGEDYAVPGQNALVLETGDPREFVGLFDRLRSNPAEGMLLRRSARTTAQRYRWEDIATRVLLPRIELLRAPA
jgi:glycosyltransferase involved in cell wall biosynthesis